MYNEVSVNHVNNGVNIVSILCAKCKRKTYIYYMNVFYVSEHLSAKHVFFLEFQVSVFGKNLGLIKNLIKKYSIS